MRVIRAAALAAAVLGAVFGFLPFWGEAELVCVKIVNSDNGIYLYQL